jgi:small subunit ribosomal protein S16
MVKIRLRRMGAKKRPFYRVVVADSRKARDGRATEVIGTYDPLTDPATVRLNRERALHWLGMGAQVTETAKYLLEQMGVWEEFLRGKGMEYEAKPVKVRAIDLSGGAEVSVAGPPEPPAKPKRPAKEPAAEEPAEEAVPEEEPVEEPAEEEAEPSPEEDAGGSEEES